MGEEVLDADGKVVVWIEQAGGFGDDAVAIMVSVGGEGDVVFAPVGDHAGHGVGAGAVHADAAVPIAGHEAKGWVYVRVEDLEGKVVLLGDARPVVDSSSSERIDSQLQCGVGEDVEVDDVCQIVDVGGDVVVAVGRGGCESPAVGRALYVSQASGYEVVGSVLDPLGRGGVGGASVGWVVLEATVLGRVVGGGDDDAVGEAVFAVAVVGEDGVGEGGCGGVGEIGVDHGLDAVGAEDLEGGGEGGLGEGVCVLCEEEGAGDGLLAAVVADGLGDGGDVVVVEGGVEGAATMAGGSKGDALGWDAGVRVERVEGSDEAWDADQGFKCGKVAWLVGGWVVAHALLCPPVDL